jgi:hypothetical protein
MTEFDFLGALGIIALFWIFVVILISYFMNGTK